MCVYEVRRITFDGHGRFIVCQDRNGPCALLAVVNFLILKWGINIKPDKDLNVSQKYLFSIVEAVLDKQLKQNVVDPEKIAELKEKCAAVLPQFAQGLYINPHVTSVSHFDKSAEALVFECLDIPLLHGLVMKDEELENIKWTSKVSYDDLQNLIASANSMVTFRNENPDNPSCSEQNTVEAMQKQDFIKDFLDVTKTMQLSVYGVSSLRRHMLIEHQHLAILYGNQHFHVVCLEDGILHTLLTDIGIRNHHPNAVWQMLHNVDGDNYMVTSQFTAANAEDSEIVEDLYFDERFEVVHFKIDHGVVDRELNLYEEHQLLSLKMEYKVLIEDELQKKLDDEILAKRHEDVQKNMEELLDMIEKEKLDKEKLAKKRVAKKAKRKSGKTPMLEDTNHKEKNTPAVSPAPPPAPTGTVPPESWVKRDFLHFLNFFSHFGKCQKPFFEGEVKAMKYREFFHFYVQYEHLAQDYQQLAIAIRDNYDSVREDIINSLVEYLEAQGVAKDVAKEATLEIVGVPRAQSFSDFLRKNQSNLVEYYVLYNGVITKRTTQTGRRMLRGILKSILERHRAGFSWNGSWEESHVEVREGIEFVITADAVHQATRDHMAADLDKLTKLFRFFRGEDTTHPITGKRTPMMPSYFEKFFHDIARIPDPEQEPEKLKKFQRYLANHLAFKSPLAITSFIVHLHTTLATENKNSLVQRQLLDTASRAKSRWMTYVINSSGPFSKVFYHIQSGNPLASSPYAEGLWCLLRYLRNSVQHLLKYITEPGYSPDIETVGLMIGHYMARHVPPLILFIICDGDIDWFLAAWRTFEESD